jgi:YD repeat-containing protein
LSVFTFAQELPEYLPKAPEAIAMDKFIDIPPGSYNGIAGYSVPLYTINVDGYSIPITINYHGMGIKVNDVASAVGLGWSLSVGGITLSQNVIGEQDEYTTRYDVNLDDFDPVYRFENTSQDYFDAFGLANQGNLMHTPLELQPDYYSYNLLNNSGKFIFDSQGTAHTIPKDDIKVITASILTDNKGLAYHFIPSSSISVTIQGASVSSANIPTYNISKIVFPSGKEINFTYIDSNQDYLANYIETEKRLIGHSDNCTKIDTQITVPRYLLEEKVLSQISFDNGLVNFEYAIAPREDIGGKQLTGIKIENTNGALIKDYDILSSFSQSPIDPLMPYTSSDPYYNGITKRLILNEVKETISKKNYKFDYYKDFQLPNRFSKSVDFWGSYNGKYRNTSYIHQYTYDDNGILRVREGADKSSSLVHAQTASLKKVTLPTGGSQEFEYELDDYKFDATENLFYKKEHTVAVTSAMFNGGNVIDIPMSIGGLDYRDGFAYKLEFYFEGNPLNESNLLDLPEGSYCYVQLLDQYNNDIQTMYHNMEIDINELSQSNTYKLRFHRNDIALPGSGRLWAKLTWYQNNPQYVANKNTGNLRIKSITLKQKNGNISLKRNYNYKNPSNPNLSSGFYTDFSKYTITEAPANTEGDVCHYKNYSSTFSGNVSSFKGKSVVYEYVTEEYINYSDSLKTYYRQKQFTLPPLYNIDYSEIPRRPDIDRSFYGGHLINEEYLDNQLNKVFTQTNVYNFDGYFASQSSNNDQGIPYDGLSAGISIQPKSIVEINGQYVYFYNWTGYYYPTRWVKLMESTSKNYFEGSTEALEQKTIYEYSDNYKHIKPISKTTTDSRGETLRTTYQYPQDDVSEPHALDLIQVNRISTPLLVTTSTANSFIKQRTIYEDLGNGIIAPKEMQTQKGTFGVLNGNSSLEPRIIYYDYDSKGNPLEVSKAKGTRIIYIWGYNDIYPIAKVENASYNNLNSAQQSAIDAVKLASNTDIDTCMGVSGCTEANLRNALNNLRTVFPESMVTTYTYDPLFGVTSIANPRGETVYYEYDTFNHLIRIKDTNGNIISENKYNYETQD